MPYIKRGSSSGFTLIELLIVILIVGLIVAVAVPNLRPLGANQEARRIYQELKLDLNFARNSALTTGETITMRPSESNKWHLGWVIETADEELKVKRQIANSGEITSQIFTDNTILTFDEKGRANLAGSFVVNVDGCSGNNQFTIDINTVGQIIVRESAC